MNYCSNCGSNKLNLETIGPDPIPRIICKNCGTIHYQNPRIIVGCLATFGDQILLCRRSIEPQKGLWNLPAGFLECNEKAEDGAIRETLEESGAEVDILKLHAVYSLPHVNQIYLHFLARMRNDRCYSTHESTEVCLFSEDSIPWDEIAFQSTTYALLKYFEFPKNYNGVHIGSYIKNNPSNT